MMMEKMPAQMPTLLERMRYSMRRAGVPEGSALLDDPDAILAHALRRVPTVLLLDPDKPEQVRDALDAIRERFGEDGGIFVDGLFTPIDRLDLGGKEYPAIDLFCYDNEGYNLDVEELGEDDILQVDELREMLDMAAPAAMGGQCVGIARHLFDFALTATFDGKVCEQRECNDLWREAISAMGREQLALMEMDLTEEPEAVEEPVLPEGPQHGDDAYARG